MRKTPGAVTVAKSFFTSLRRLRRDNAGATAVEFAIIAIPFLLILLGIFQMLVLFFFEQALQSAAETGGRLIMTGTAQTSGYAQKDFKAAVCTAAGPAFNCGKLYVDVQSAVSFSSLNTAPLVLTYDSSGNVSNAFTYSPGVQTNAVIVRVMYNYPAWWPKLMPFFSNQPGNNFLLTATSVLRNEPYP